MSNISSEHNLVRLSAADLPDLSIYPKEPGRRYGVPDEENPEWTEQMFESADRERERRLAERGLRRVPLEIDVDTWAKLLQQGGDPSEHANEALRRYVERHERDAAA